MTKLHEKFSVNKFSLENINIQPIEEIINSLPANGVVDLNIAERCLLLTLEGQNLCQERVIQIDRWVGHLEAEKNKAWSNAALTKAIKAGLKTAKDKEWFAQADDDYIEACNELTLAKACKKWLENKASYFSGWHYALKTFLKRDYSLEASSSLRYGTSMPDSTGYPAKERDDDASAAGWDDDWGKDIEWGQ
jgi:hypothetical protein